ncbi:MAG: C-GCAxxG-C-C family protein [Candidatus Humimicrobiaceae bacterium]
MCGALSGTIMAMGMVEGRNNPADNDAKLKLYKKVTILLDAFNAEFKTTDCRELTGCNLLSEDGLKKLKMTKSMKKYVLNLLNLS